MLFQFASCIYSFFFLLLPSSDFSLSLYTFPSFSSSPCSSVSLLLLYLCTTRIAVAIFISLSLSLPLPLPLSSLLSPIEYRHERQDSSFIASHVLAHSCGVLCDNLGLQVKSNGHFIGLYFILPHCRLGTGVHPSLLSSFTGSFSLEKTNRPGQCRCSCSHGICRLTRHYSIDTRLFHPSLYGRSVRLPLLHGLSGLINPFTLFRKCPHGHMNTHTHRHKHKKTHTHTHTHTHMNRSTYEGPILTYGYMVTSLRPALFTRTPPLPPRPRRRRVCRKIIINYCTECNFAN